MKYFKKNFTINVLNILLLIFCTCTDKIALEELYGKYVYNQKGYNDYILLLKSGNYTHIHHDSSKNKGKWRYDVKLKEIVFEDFIFYNELGGEEAGFWIPKVKKVNDEIRLIYALEEGLYYAKQ